MFVAVAAGTLVQGLVGLGLGLLAAPVTVLVAPQLMPDMLLWLVLTLPLLTLLRDHDGVDWRGLAWVVPGRLPGIALGVAAVAAFSDDALGVAVGLMVLLATLLTWRSVRIPMTRPSLLGAGVVSGFTGTTTSVGGPPVALLYQHRPPAQIRSTLAVYFVLGGVLSLAGLGLGGQLSPASAVVALSLLPALAVGTVSGGVLRERLAPERVRPLVLLACAASATTVLVVSLS
ncbi:sulfite exporter TauE/SafE family protein [Nocardioides sp. CFH 31398]|uniref:sulfite exporter TauE/SafE family protein n=1 Tax=Nocardioides sp. CFH 31398 TaxID=2919579 RepID=UPI001F056776|nr:sulfite exporter TauE/SafE family protein [Nocardioides sp. CFH 31398]MCH1866671.1 sulfite exporter TauE/SafE family protein [Nocardioides sp. CFH 31398]